MQDEDFGEAARLAFEMRHPGRLLAVVRQVLELGPRQAGATLARLAAAMSDGDVQQCLEYCRWVASAPSRTAGSSPPAAPHRPPYINIQHPCFAPHAPAPVPDPARPPPCPPPGA